MTTNTHIAAQARQTSAQLRKELPRWNVQTAGLMKDAADLLEQAAQALEAAPALDAQGEARNATHLELLRDLISNDAYALSFQTMGQYRTAILKAFAAAPPPPAVGKPLSDSEILSGAKWFHDHSDFADGVRFAEKHHGIVTKETGNG